MKIAFIGDTHHNEKAIKTALKYVNEFETNILIHLGDCVSDVVPLKEGFKGDKIYAVAGNCDYTTAYPKENLIDVNGKKIFFTHGDLYGVKNSLNSIALKGECVNADIILFGHSHCAFREEYRNMIFMNPGSIPKPYPSNGRRCVGLIEIDDLGNIITAKLKDIEI